MKCSKCNTFLPPGYVHEVDPETNVALACPTCEFCLKDIKVIRYGEGKQVTKKELEKEYKLFIRKLKEDSSVLKNIVEGKETAPKIIL